MPFPSTVSSTASLDEALKQVTSYAGAAKQRAQGMVNDSLAGSVAGAAIVNFLRDLVIIKGRLAERASTPGLVEYAKTQYNDPNLDIVAEYQTMVAAINATITWIRNSFPKDPSNYLLYEQIGVDGTVSYRMFTTAELTPFRTQLQALIATIN